MQRRARLREPAQVRPPPLRALPEQGRPQRQEQRRWRARLLVAWLAISFRERTGGKRNLPAGAVSVLVGSVAAARAAAAGAAVVAVAAGAAASAGLAGFFFSSSVFFLKAALSFDVKLSKALSAGVEITVSGV